MLFFFVCCRCKNDPVSLLSREIMPPVCLACLLWLPHSCQHGLPHHSCQHGLPQHSHPPDPPGPPRATTHRPPRARALAHQLNVEHRVCTSCGKPCPAEGFTEPCPFPQPAVPAWPQPALGAFGPLQGCNRDSFQTAMGMCAPVGDVSAATHSTDFQALIYLPTPLALGQYTLPAIKQAMDMQASMEHTTSMNSEIVRHLKWLKAQVCRGVCVWHVGGVHDGGCPTVWDGVGLRHPQSSLV